MKNHLIMLACILVFASEGFSHGEIQGIILSNHSKTPVEAAHVKILNAANRFTYSDPHGRFEFNYLNPGLYYLEVISLGYKTSYDTVEVREEEGAETKIYLEEDILQLPEVKVSAGNEFYQTINSFDFKFRTHNTTQDLLRLVPGLFIAQHAGGGKAEQLFLRGFDIDHGTDVSISVDGMPVNMVSHAHGHGYADLHFIIPETIEHIRFSKGPYDAGVGNFNTAGAVQLRTKNVADKNLIKYETGRFNTHRGLVLMNLFPLRDSSFKRPQVLLAGEYFLSDLYFSNPQNLNRYNVFAKFSRDLSHHTNLTLSFSAFSSRWDASGQIPQRAVDRCLVSWFGSIDPTEGGKTSRNNANAHLTSYLHNGGVISQQLYFVDYSFNLYSNFTFFKDDSINGDQIRQHERRQFYGYNGSYKKQGQVGSCLVTAIAGIGYRGDFIKNVSLSRTIQRKFLSDITRGDIIENNWNAYLSLDFHFSEKLMANAGIRYDYFSFAYKNRLTDARSSSRQNGIMSPKFNLYYKIASNVQLYLKGGYGFHSNDARVSVVRTDTTSLPKAKSVDLGTDMKIGKKIILNTAGWYMFLESEYAYVGDGGFIEPTGSTVRLGLDFSARYQILPWLFADIDLTWARARYTDLPQGENYIPLAPSITATGGVGVVRKKGLSGSLRFRHLAERPAAGDYSVKATGYFLIDAVILYQRNHWQFSLSAENLLNRRWKEAQFATTSLLPGEPEPVTENHFTPGTPLFIKAGVAFLF